MTTFTCIRPGCESSYESDDVEAYYCPVCLKKKKEVAAQIDKSIGSRPRKQEASALQAFEAQGRTLVSNTGDTKGFATFIKVKL